MTEAIDDPTVSVIIPTFNRAHLVSRAIRSVLAQTYQDFEIIVVDDGSTDNTKEIVKSFNDSRIRYVRHDENRGGSAARNTGIRIAQGEYIAFLDDDDEWLPEKLEKQIKKFKSLPKKFGVVYSGFSYVSERGKILSNVIPTLRGNVYDSLLKDNILGSPTPLIKRDCFQRAGFFDETFPSCQDWDMWIRLSKCYYFDFVPDILAKHYVHENRISANLNARIIAREKLIRKYWADLSQRPQTLSMHFSKLGKLYSLVGDFIKARRYFLASIKNDPFRENNYIHLFLLTLFPRVHRVMLEMTAKLLRGYHF